MTPARVLHVSQPSEAGVAAVLLSYLSDFDPDLIHAVACPDASMLSRETVRRGHEHVPWNASREPGRTVAGETRALARIFRQVDPDLVHLHSSKAGLAGRLALRGSRPTVFQPHAWSFSAATGVSQTLSLRWERAAQRWTHATVCVGHDERRRGLANGVLSTSHPTRGGFVLPNVVDPECWPIIDRATARTRLGLPPATPLAVCVGRLCRQKGQDLLLAAWPHVVTALRTNPSTVAALPRLVLVGDGPDRRSLEAIAPLGVRLIGADEPHAWYAAADVVVVPSRWEAMAMVPLEAQASGRLVVATDVDGIREGLHPGHLIVPAEDPDALAVALTWALSSLPTATATGKLARELAERQWRRGEQHHQLRDIYAAAAAAMQTRPGAGGQ